MMDGTGVEQYRGDIEGIAAKNISEAVYVAAVYQSGGTTWTFTYDAWGNPIGSISGTMAATLGTLNPLRYRGYVYDQETQLYYLQSRYYIPETGRFLNADNIISATTHTVTACIKNATASAKEPDFEAVDALLKEQESTEGNVKLPKDEKGLLYKKEKLWWSYNWKGNVLSVDRGG